MKLAEVTFNCIRIRLSITVCAKMTVVNKFRRFVIYYAWISALILIYYKSFHSFKLISWLPQVAHTRSPYLRFKRGGNLYTAYQLKALAGKLICRGTNLLVYTNKLCRPDIVKLYLITNATALSRYRQLL